jgi:hypothetical protein
MSEIFAVPSCSMIKPTNKNDSYLCGGFYVPHIQFEWIDRKKFCIKVHSTTQPSTSQFRTSSCLTSGVTPPIHDGKALFASVRKALASKTKSRTHITKYH